MQNSLAYKLRDQLMEQINHSGAGGLDNEYIDKYTSQVQNMLNDPEEWVYYYTGKEVEAYFKEL